MHMISDLAAYCRDTSGDVPAKLIGASTSVIGSKMYLFGGRPVTGTKISSDMYVCDLDTFVWEKLPFSDEERPPARYFHSAEIWNQQIVVFGGFGGNRDSLKDLCVLNDVQIFDPDSRKWLSAQALNSGEGDLVPAPKPRHSHLSSVTADRLFVIGGQDLRNAWLDDIYVYDLWEGAWVQQCRYPRHYGTYLSVAVAADQCVRLPPPRTSHRGSEAPANTPPLSPPTLVQSFYRSTQPPSPMQLTPPPTALPHGVTQLASPISLGAPPPPDFRLATSPASSSPGSSKSTAPMHLPYSAPPSTDFPSNVYLYSNYNFTDVKRKLEVFSPLPTDDFTIHDRSPTLGEEPCPPCLRFPTGAIIGTHLLIAGTHLSPTTQTFAVWSLNLLSLTWTQIDTGNDVAASAWFQGCLWRDANKFLMFGNRTGNNVNDFSHRLSSWDRIAVIDLEAFGIYQPPKLEFDFDMQELSLTALEERVGSDYEIVCDDGRKIKCSRKLLEDRWPWFQAQLARLLENAKLAMGIASSSPPPPTPTKDMRPDPRVTSRAFDLSEPYPVTMALMQYFYTLSLLTPLQQAPAVLSQLLVLSTNYQIPRLQSLVKHAMHLALSESTCVGVYEVATLCGCRSLQIRAFKAAMGYSKKRAPSRQPPQPRPSRQENGDHQARSAGDSRSNSSNQSSSPSSTTIRPPERPEPITYYRSPPPGPVEPAQPIQPHVEFAPPPEQTKTSLPSPPPDASDQLPRVKAKKSKLFDKVLRGNSDPPTPKKVASPKSPKWRTGGGRHPVVADRAIRAEAAARKAAAIEAALNSDTVPATPRRQSGDRSSASGQDSSNSAESLRDFAEQNPTNRGGPLQSSRPPELSDLGNDVHGVPAIHTNSNQPPRASSKPLSPIHESGTPLRIHIPYQQQGVPRPHPVSAANMQNRSFQLLSASAEDDLRNMAELMSPVVTATEPDRMPPQRPDQWTIGDDADSIIEPSIQGDYRDIPVPRLPNLSFD